MTVQEWVAAYGAAWEARDPAAAAALFTEDASYRSLIYEEPHTGHDGVADYWRTVTATQSDVRVRMGKPFADGERVALEFWTNMNADGAPVTLAGCLLLDFAADGRCQRLREYWNFAVESADPPPEYGS